LGLTYIWQGQQENNINRINRIIKERCKGTEGSDLLSEVRERISLAFYNEMKQRWQKEAYVNCCYRKERIEIAWWR
jgi:hypothetical protein